MRKCGKPEVTLPISKSSPRQFYGSVAEVCERARLQIDLRLGIGLQVCIPKGKRRGIGISKNGFAQRRAATRKVFAVINDA